MNKYRNPARLPALLLALTLAFSLTAFPAFAEETRITGISISANEDGTQVCAMGQNIGVETAANSITVTGGTLTSYDANLFPEITPVTVEVNHGVSNESGVGISYNIPVIPDLSLAAVYANGSDDENAPKVKVEMNSNNVSVGSVGSAETPETAGYRGIAFGIYADGQNVAVNGAGEVSAYVSMKHPGDATNISAAAIFADHGAKVNANSAHAEGYEAAAVRAYNDSKVEVGTVTAQGVNDALAVYPDSGSTITVGTATAEQVAGESQSATITAIQAGEKGKVTADKAIAKSTDGTATAVRAQSSYSDKITEVTVKEEATAETVKGTAVGIDASGNVNVTAGSVTAAAKDENGTATGVRADGGSTVNVGTTDESGTFTGGKVSGHTGVDASDVNTTINAGDVSGVNTGVNVFNGSTVNADSITADGTGVRTEKGATVNVKKSIEAETGIESSLNSEYPTLITVGGDVTASNTGLRVFADPSATPAPNRADVVIGGTLSGQNPVELGAGSLNLTVWRVQRTLEDGSIVPYDEQNKNIVNDDFDKTIRYIIRVEKNDHATITTKKENGSALDPIIPGGDSNAADSGAGSTIVIDGAGTANAGDRILIEVTVDKGYVLAAVYADSDKQVEIKPVDGKYIFEVPKGGGVVISADVEKKKFTVAFYSDEKELQSGLVEYGETPRYDKDKYGEPTRAGTAQYTFTWDGGWEPAIVPVEEAAVYKATFKSVTNSYQVTFDTDGGTLDASDGASTGGTYKYDESIKLPDATRDGYILEKWEDADGNTYEPGTIVKVTGSKTFTAAVWKQNDTDQNQNNNENNNSNGNQNNNENNNENQNNNQNNNNNENRNPDSFLFPTGDNPPAPPGPQVGSGMNAFELYMENIIEEIKNAEENGALIIDVRKTGWTSLKRGIFEAAAERRDLTIIILYTYQGADYSVTIPAGTDLSPVITSAQYLETQTIGPTLGITPEPYTD